MTKETIEELPHGQVEVVSPIEKTEPVRSAAPTMNEEAQAAYVEGEALLERLSTEDVIIGAGDPEAEVLRALIGAVGSFVTMATTSLAEIRSYVEQRMAQIG